MGGNTSKNKLQSPLKGHIRFTSKTFMHTPREGLYQSCSLLKD